MNIVSRLYKILSSRIPHFEKRENWQNNVDQQRGYRFTSQKNNLKAKARDREYQTDYDPVLAGLYANLELPYGAGLEQVKKAWKRLLAKYHPDLHSNDPEKRKVANELCQGLNRAYAELANHLKNLNSKK